MRSFSQRFPALRRSLRFIRNAVSPHVVVTAAPASIHVDWDVPVRVRDGTTLRVNVFRPKGSGRFPVIMSRSSLRQGQDSRKDPQRPRCSAAVAIIASAASCTHLQLHQLGSAGPLPCGLPRAMPSSTQTSEAAALQKG